MAILEVGLDVIGDSPSIQRMLDDIVPPEDRQDDTMSNQGSEYNYIDTNEPTHHDDDTSEPRDINKEAYAAYYRLLNELVVQYGISGDRWESSGLFRATLVDFDGDGVDSLVIYYLAEFEWMNDYTINYGGYLIYGYDNISNTVFMRHHYPAEESHPTIEHCYSIFRGQNNKIYVLNEYSRAMWIVRDYYTIEHNEWINVYSFLADRFDDGYVYYVDTELVSEAEVQRRIEVFESELLFVLDGASSGNILDAYMEPNILEILWMLAEYTSH
jgi:hypothetical protein